MEQFKEKLRVQNLIFSLLTVLMLVFFIWYRAGIAGRIWFPEPAGSREFQDFWEGFIHGGLAALWLILICLMVRNTAAMKDEAKLKKLFVQENDERSQQIAVYARAASTQAFLFGGLAAASIAGFFSMAVSLTIIACVLANGLLAISFKLYYNKKF